MAKILLVNPSYQNSYGGSIGALVNPIFPVLSLASLAAVARKNDHQVEVLDLSWHAYHPRYIEERIKSMRPDVVGFSVLSPSMNQVKDMSFAVKKINPHILCIAGGPHVSALAEESIQESSLDAVVIGEGEETLREILSGKNLHGIDGLAIRNGEGAIFTPERKPILDINSLPIPAWDIFDLNMYARMTSRLYARRTPFITAEFSRGCIYKCDFCASKLTMGFGYRKKSPERCAEEVRVMKSLGVREFALADDIFTTDAKWAGAVCDELIKADTGVKWSCTNGIRVESAEEGLFRKMKEAGCYRVAFGFESGNDEVLKSFGKGGRASLAKGEEAVREARKAGLETLGFFMVGLSSDNKETIYETVEFARRLPLDLLKFGVTIAFPGTKMFRDYESQGMIKSYDWDNYHIYSGFRMFAHPELSYEDIQTCIRKAYRKAAFFNPGFLYRRLKNSILTGDFLSEIRFFFRFLRLSYSKTENHTEYPYRHLWEYKSKRKAS